MTLDCSCHSRRVGFVSFRLKISTMHGVRDICLRRTQGSHRRCQSHEDAEWEMLWDAEGAMHLVKKSLPQTSVSKLRVKKKCRSLHRPGRSYTAILVRAARIDFGKMVEPMTFLATVNFSLYGGEGLDVILCFKFDRELRAYFEEVTASR
ncbi:uncharacterized protein LOC112342190 [Selaginella moellendorffii]|uniref:uncharacterized protein LOC112342190 n=1 Tax=Selaginella moellendorffii TaxID=88036 RepID=UPI000D1CF447|nr:uncharacterized protein LOC112342190 [Selaginella moellendorffii]|eukprot:XP_024519388.1 uncharacterized protein LOC112342190 [Selaginella moellendorffii]